MGLGVIFRILMGRNLTPLQRYSRGILQPKLIGITKVDMQLNKTNKQVKKKSKHNKQKEKKKTS